MRCVRSGLPAALGFALAMLNGGCILIPEIKDRLVELAVGGTTTQVFTVLSSSTSVDQTEVVNVGSDLDLAQILADAGIDHERVTHVALAGIEYRIITADPDPNRTISNGAIHVDRGVVATPQTPLVTGFSATPGVVSGFEDLQFDPPGVAVINQLLTEIVTALPGVPANPDVTFRLTGTANGQPIDFDFELRIRISITGTVSVEVPT